MSQEVIERTPSEAAEHERALQWLAVVVRERSAAGKREIQDVWSGLQKVALHDERDNKLFMLVNDGIQVDASGRTKTISQVPSGLYVYGVQLDVDGAPISRLPSLRLSSFSNQTQTYPYLKRESTVDITALREQISRANVVDLAQYESAARKVAIQNRPKQ